MITDEFSKQQYATLRAEISESKSRIFWLLIVGIFLVLASGYLAAVHPSGFANAAIPFLLLAIMLSFIAEESNVSRAGRYLREEVEPKIHDLTCWEHWLESQKQYREVDRSFVVGFSVIFMTFYVVSATLTLRQLDSTGRPQQFVWAAATAYALGGFCILYVLVRHWISSTKPSPPDDDQSNDDQSDNG